MGDRRARQAAGTGQDQARLVRRQRAPGPGAGVRRRRGGRSPAGRRRAGRHGRRGGGAGAGRRWGRRSCADDPDAGLNPALEHGVELLRSQRPRIGVATLSADLPALAPADLAWALRQVGPGQRAFVADVDGTGTTLLAAGPGARPAAVVRPRAHGPAHLSSGAVELLRLTGLRRDVDTPDDLQAALALGVGRAHRSSGRAADVKVVQATVRDWSPETGGTALLDDGQVVPLPASLEGSPFRLLRSGQRVRLTHGRRRRHDAGPARDAEGPGSSRGLLDVVLASASWRPSWQEPSSRRLLGRSLLRGRLLGRSLLRRSLLRRSLLGRRLLGRSLLRRRLLGRSLLRRRLLGRSLLRGSLLRRSLLRRRLLGRSLLSRRLLGSGLLGGGLLGEPSSWEQPSWQP